MPLFMDWGSRDDGVGFDFDLGVGVDEAGDLDDGDVGGHGEG